MKKTIWIIIILLVLSVAGYYLLNNNKIKTKVEEGNQKENVVAEETPSGKDNASTTSVTIPKIPSGERIPSRYACVGEYCDGSMSGEDYKYTVLKIPFIRDGGKIGCGAEVFYGYDTTTPKTQAVMDATFKRLFDIKQWPEIKEDGFRNTVAAFTYLYYDHVTLSNGLAKVYLLGKVTSPGTCAEPELKAQIEAAAFQFNNVDKLEVYLNDKPFDWCLLDVSGGQGGCNKAPKYWITNK